MKKINAFLLLLSALTMVPTMAYALITDVCVSLTGLGKFLCTMQQLLNSVVPVLVALGVVYFVWGVVRYVIADGEEGKEKGKDTMVYGIIGFAVIIGLWGLVNILVTTFGLQIAAPTLETLSIQPGQGSCTIGNNSTLKDILCFATRLINDSVIPFIFAIATALFVWGAVKFFIIHADEEAQRDQGRQFMIWGIVALAVMLSVWGLVGVLTKTIGVRSVLPQVQPSGP